MSELDLSVVLKRECISFFRILNFYCLLIKYCDKFKILLTLKND